MPLLSAAKPPSELLDLMGEGGLRRVRSCICRLFLKPCDPELDHPFLTSAGLCPSPFLPLPLRSSLPPSPRRPSLVRPAVVEKRQDSCGQQDRPRELRVQHAAPVAVLACHGARRDPLPGTVRCTGRRTRRKRAKGRVCSVHSRGPEAEC